MAFIFDNRIIAHTTPQFDQAKINRDQFTFNSVTFEKDIISEVLATNEAHRTDNFTDEDGILHAVGYVPLQLDYGQSDW